MGTTITSTATTITSKYLNPQCLSLLLILYNNIHHLLPPF
jgi:hypothetical protein